VVRSGRPTSNVKHPYLAEAIVREHAADVAMARHQPRLASIPKLDLGDGILRTQPGKLNRRFGACGSAEGEGWHCTQVTSELPTHSTFPHSETHRGHLESLA
jgi:hypothetical protein